MVNDELSSSARSTMSSKPFWNEELYGVAGLLYAGVGAGQLEFFGMGL